MKLVAALLVLLAFTNYVVAEECDNAAGERCLQSLLRAYEDNEGGQMDCVELKQSMDCILNLAERCLSEQERAESQEYIDRLQETVRKICPAEERNENEDDDFDDSGLSDEEKEMIECIRDEQKLVTYVGQCVENTMNAMRSGELVLPRNLRDSSCRTYLSIARCTAGKVGEDCGEVLEQPFFSGMMVALKNEDPRAAESPECAITISRAEDYLSNVHKRIRRSTRDVSFAKLIP